MTLSERIGIRPATPDDVRRCNDPSGCRRQTTSPDAARCDDHRERWIPEWMRRAQEHETGLARDLTGLEAL